MTNTPDEEPRSLAHIPAEQIVRYSPETVIEWLLERNAQHRERLAAATQSLRTESQHRERAYERLGALLRARYGSTSA